MHAIVDNIAEMLATSFHYLQNTDEHLCDHEEKLFLLKVILGG